MAEGGKNNTFPGFEETPTQELMKQMADQNSRLLLILERLTMQQAAPVAKRSPEQIIESLSSTIKEFCFDPEAGLTFDRWFNKYEDLFSADGRELDDAAKVRLLLRSLSVPVHEKFTNYLLPQHPRDFTFEQVVQKLKAIFGQQKSLFSKRYDCFRVVKSDADDYVTYAGIVNRQCEDFDLANLTIDQFKALIFICGMQSSKEAEVRTRLLSKLESEAGREINLEVLITECQRLSNLKHDTALVEQHSSFSVQAVQKHTQQHLLKQPTAASFNTNMPRSPCWQCGEMHFVKDCSYTHHVCTQCNRQGHKEGYCSCFNNTVKTSGESEQSSPQQQQQQEKPNNKKKQFQLNSIYLVNQVRSERKYVTTRINGYTMALQLDCGSDITIISEQAWKKCGSPAFKQTEHRTKTASGKQLPLLGQFTCTMQIGEGQQHGTCYVTSVKDLNLLGLDFMNAFDVWSKPLSSICDQVNHSNSTEPINARLEECLTLLPVNFKMVSAATRKDAILQQVVQFIDGGWPRKVEDPKLKAFHSRRKSLSVVNGCIMMEDRIVVPEFHSQRILKQLHQGHQGMERMKAIARSVVYWPNIDDDIQDLVRRCDICASAAKSPQISSKPDKDSPKYAAGSTVYAKLYDHTDKWKWTPGTVIEAIGGVNFNVLLDYHSGRRRLIRSHVNQLRPRFNDTVKPSTVQTTLDILVNDFELKQQSSVQQTAPQNLSPIEPEPDPERQQQGDSSDYKSSSKWKLAQQYPVRQLNQYQ